MEHKVGAGSEHKGTGRARAGAYGQRASRRATYRLQLHAGFGFSDAAAITGYLADLGISHVYLSPVLQAAKGSTHGYDVVDPAAVNEELGGDQGYLELQMALGEAALGQILDVVPNHMAVATRENRWWWDVLENGPSSIYAGYFDVDWGTPETNHPHGNSVVLLPILGDHYGRELEAGRFKLEHSKGTFTVRYYEQQVPIAPRSLDQLVAKAARRLPRGFEPGVQGRSGKHRDGPGPASTFMGHRPGQREGTSPRQRGPAGPADGPVYPAP